MAECLPDIMFLRVYGLYAKDRRIAALFVAYAVIEIVVNCVGVSLVRRNTTHELCR